MITEIQPSPWAIAPFVALLAAIALAPLLVNNWWGRHFAKVTFGLAALTLGYYFGGLHAPGRVVSTATEYFSFICLVGSLFVVSGGIHIDVKGEATPAANVLFLFIGALAANLLGTTGASMLLVRPWLRMNRYRLTTHHVTFFIFIVSNVGGCLTPVGDPPLFLGYLHHVPFWWVAEQCWPIWLTGVGLLLLMFFVVDERNFRRAPKPVRDYETAREVWRCRGLGNLAFLAFVLGAVFIQRPPLLREGLMILAAVGSYLTTDRAIHEANDFNFQPIREVTVLFAGIFATMMPALDWLEANAAQLGHPSSSFFFWASGALSSVLDNAPTYLSFLSAAFGTFIPADTAGAIAAYLNQHGAALGAVSSAAPHAEQIRQAISGLGRMGPAGGFDGYLTPERVQMALLLGNPLYSKCLVAISVGSVFFGANTYIGNGPNFMVKAIADQQKAHSPTFVGYIFGFSIPFMLSMLFVVWLVYFRN